MQVQTARLTDPAWKLLLRAIGGPRQLAGKFIRIGRTLRLWFDAEERRRRLDCLAAAGFLRERPTALQIAFGGFDMLRFLITPGARDYYQQRGFSFSFHVLLRFLDDPMSLIDPTGLLSDRDTIVGHVLQVVHLNPVFDLQLIQMFPDGLEDFEDQVLAMVDGSHPRHGTIGAIVEEPDYHDRLLGYVRRFRADPDTAPLVRRDQSLRDDPVFSAAERTFATLPGFFAYCVQLPKAGLPLLVRFFQQRRFPMALAPAAR
jgi:hypothetical protein